MTLQFQQQRNDLAASSKRSKSSKKKKKKKTGERPKQFPLSCWYWLQEHLCLAVFSTELPVLYLNVAIGLNHWPQFMYHCFPSKRHSHSYPDGDSSSRSSLNCRSAQRRFRGWAGVDAPATRWFWWSVHFLLPARISSRKPAGQKMQQTPL